MTKKLGKGWHFEYPEHALAGKGISLGRKKKKIATIPKTPANIVITQQVAPLIAELPKEIKPIIPAIPEEAKPIKEIEETPAGLLSSMFEETPFEKVFGFGEKIGEKEEEVAEKFIEEPSTPFSPEKLFFAGEEIGERKKEEEKIPEDIEITSNELFNSMKIGTGQGMDELKGEEQKEFEQEEEMLRKQELFGEVSEKELQALPPEHEEDLLERIGEAEVKVGKKAIGLAKSIGKKIAEKLKERGHPPEEAEKIGEEHAEEIVEDLAKQRIIKED